MLNTPGYPKRNHSVHETLDNDHGRSETRRFVVVDNLDWLDLSGLKVRWTKLTSVACIESTREIGDKITTEQRYVISSLPADSERILHAVRTHGSITILQLRVI